MSSRRRARSFLLRVGAMPLLAVGIPGLCRIAPVGAETPGFDVRGRWEWTFSPIGCSKHCPSYDGTVTIKQQDPARGGLAGTYKSPRKTITVTGRHMMVGLAEGPHPAPASGRLAQRQDAVPRRCLRSASLSAADT